MTTTWLFCLALGLFFSDAFLIGRQKRALTCSQSWNLYGGSCYSVQNARVTYTEAQQQCALLGGYVTRIQDEPEFKFVKALGIKLLETSDSPYWLGGKNVSGVWTWDDGTRISYASWAGNEPDYLQGTCLMVGSSQLWKAIDCLKPRRFICEKSADYVPDPTTAAPVVTTVTTSVPVTAAVTTGVPVTAAVTTGVPVTDAPLPEAVPVTTQNVPVTEVFTTAPEVFTTAPEVFTTAPEVFTTAPEVFTAAPEVFTTAPEVFTTTPEVFTAAPEVYTAAPEVFTVAPEVFTTAPEVLTAAPEVFTAAPEVFTTAPEVFTTAPEVFTTSPEVFTTAPEVFTTAPEVFTTAPEVFTTAPEVFTTAPEVFTTTAEVTITCDRQYYGTQGRFDSSTCSPSGANGPYSNNAHYRFRIWTNGDLIFCPQVEVQVNIEVLNIESPSHDGSSCPWDYVEVVGSTGRNCGVNKWVYTTSTVSWGSAVEIRFVSDSSVTYRGFIVYYSINNPCSGSGSRSDYDYSGTDSPYNNTSYPYNYDTTGYPYDFNATSYPYYYYNYPYYNNATSSPYNYDNSYPYDYNATSYPYYYYNYPYYDNATSYPYNYDNSYPYYVNGTNYPYYYDTNNYPYYDNATSYPYNYDNSYLYNYNATSYPYYNDATNYPYNDTTSSYPYYYDNNYLGNFGDLSDGPSYDNQAISGLRTALESLRANATELSSMLYNTQQAIEDARYYFGFIDTIGG